MYKLLSKESIHQSPTKEGEIRLEAARPWITSGLLLVSNPIHIIY